MNYLNDDTIAALSTATGESALAVIRLSGENAFQIVNKIFQTKSKPQQQVKYGYIIDKAEKKDEVLCTFFKAPRTYTGENLVEISLHGNPVIINETLNLLYKNGARPANPGEFTYRAFLNGKKDLAEAEAICNLIASKTVTSAKVALNNISGYFSQKIKNIRDSVTNLIAFIEANLDHPEENVIFLSHDKKITLLDSCIHDVQKLLASYKTGKFLQSGIKVAIIGKPNTGKSSLFNAILGRNKAIVTNIAGTTTDTIEESVIYNGVQLIIKDTAGIRKRTKNSIEVLGHKKTKEAIETSDTLIWLFDASCQLDKNDIKIYNLLKKLKLNIPIICIINKIDLPVKLLFETSLNLRLLFSAIIKISVKTEIGICDLLNEITKITNTDAQNNYLMINSRHFALLQNVLDALIKTKTLITTEDNNDEIVCFEATQAQTALNEILGINIKQEILDTIFSTFCIGK
ncbi:MAG: tRNA uridine-5-carboxymethylaminomethyl(34) synthesis GTPase MnmE [Endomicrobium sp.]|jgi:tRNA modification GTPase|nr:tRNA uridine-5-carboxymethylaminomethyl(34) synthesis GTPase MnmE [Endomicrobium sp.]